MGARRFGIWLAVVVVVDQGTKLLARHLLPVDALGVTLLPGLLFLTQVRNPGLAGGTFPGAGMVAVLIAAAAVLAVLADLEARQRRGEVFAPAVTFGLALAL